MRTRSVTTAAALTAAAGLGLAAAAPATAANHATLSVLHGVPGLTVDVWVNGERTLDDFAPGELAGPLELPAGTYTVAITTSDAADASSPAIGPVDLPLQSGGSYTAVAHLTADGDPTATLFTNDTSQTAAGQGRLTVRHVAAAPAVDVLAGGTPVMTNLTNPNEQVLNLPAGTVSAAVAPTGTTDPVLGPTDVTIAEGVSTILYAWGSLDDDTLAIAAQTIDGLHSAPAGVPSGELGLASTGGDAGTVGAAWLIAAMAGVGVAGLAAVGAARRRTATVATVDSGR